MDNQYNNYSSNGYSTVAEGVTVVSKRSKLPFILGGVGVLAAAAAAVCLFVPSVNNSIRMAVMSPSNYFAHVESVNFEAYGDEAADGYQKVLDLLDTEKGFGVDYSAKIVAGDDLKAVLDEELRGELKLDSIGAQFSIDAKDKKASISGAINVNDKKLADIKTYTDTEKLYAQIPQLSSAYIFTALNIEDEDMEVLNKLISGIEKNPITASDVDDLITKYARLIFENLDDVELEKGVSGTVNTVDYEYNKLTINISNENATNIAKEVLDELKADETVKKFFTETGICTAEKYSAKLDEAIKEVNEPIDEKEKNDNLQIVLLVNNVGKIMGRTYTITTEGKSTQFLNYVTAEDGDDYAAELKFSGSEVAAMEESTSGSSQLVVNVTPTGEDGVYSGTATILDEGKEMLKYTFENIKCVNEDKGYCTGKVIMTGELFDDIESEGLTVDKMELTFESDGSSQKYTMGFGKLLDLEMEYSFDEAGEIVAPSGDMYDANDEEQMMNYYESMDLEGFMKTVGDCFGMSEEDVSSLFSTLLLGDMGDTGYDDFDNEDFGEFEAYGF